MKSKGLVRRTEKKNRVNKSKQRAKISNIMTKGTLTSHFSARLNQLPPSTASSMFQNVLEPEARSESLPSDFDACEEDTGFILSQDFFCTPDYITPEMAAVTNDLDWNKDYMQCPNSPEKIKTTKRPRLDSSFTAPLEPAQTGHQPLKDLAKDILEAEEDENYEKPVDPQKKHSYVSQSAVALRCRVMPPPCLKNPFNIKEDSLGVDADPFGNQRSKCAGLPLLSPVFNPAGIGGDGLSRYRTDFHEIEKIGNGNFSHVFKVLKRIDGCFYAVKHSKKQLNQDTERRTALMEVQALAALGYHENIVFYHSSWFENEKLYIQLELCDRSLSINDRPRILTEPEALSIMHQIAKALHFIHERGVAHLDVKPDNIYVKNGTYKLGDFGCATLIDKSLPLEEGDARYMPHEILNDNYDNLDKVDIFSLGASIYELVRGSPLPESGPQFLNLREGKFPLLPGHSLQFQNLIKAMMDADPVRRPSAREIVENPIFERQLKGVRKA